MDADAWISGRAQSEYPDQHHISIPVAQAVEHGARSTKRSWVWLSGNASPDQTYTLNALDKSDCQMYKWQCECTFPRVNTGLVGHSSLKN